METRTYVTYADNWTGNEIEYTVDVPYDPVLYCASFTVHEMEFSLVLYYNDDLLTILSVLDDQGTAVGTVTRYHSSKARDQLVRGDVAMDSSRMISRMAGNPVKAAVKLIANLY